MPERPFCEFLECLDLSSGLQIRVGGGGHYKVSRIFLKLVHALKRWPHMLCVCVKL